MTCPSSQSINTALGGQNSIITGGQFSVVITRDRSAIHDGAAILRFISEPEKSLKGEYWTSRKTTGDINVKFISKR